MSICKIEKANTKKQVNTPLKTIERQRLALVTLSKLGAVLGAFDDVLVHRALKQEVKICLVTLSVLPS